MVSAGKVRYLGAGSMYAWQFAKAHYTAVHSGGPGFVSMRGHYNLVYREEEREMILLCRDLGAGVIPWSPLARGLLTGSRHRDGVPRTPRAATDEYARQLYTSDDFDIVDTLGTVADERGLPPAQVALAWLLTKPGVSAPIIGATAPHHLDDAEAALDVVLSNADRERLEAQYRTRPVRGHQ